MANYATTSNHGLCGNAVEWRKLHGRLAGIFLFAFFAASVGTFAEEKQTRRSERNRETRNTAATVDDSLEDSLRRIPWDSLSSTAKAKIKPVIASHSIFRRLPQQVVYTDSEIYQFLIEHPDIVVGFWEKLGVTQISLRELSEDRFLMKETSGTTAVAEVLYRTQDLCVIYARGQYRGGLLAKPIDGETVLILRSRFFCGEDNEPYIVSQLDSFVRLDNVGADLIVKLLSNVLGKVADSNFEHTIGFVGNVSDAATNNSERVKELSSQMKGVRKDIRDDFSDVVDRVAARGVKRGTRVFPEYAELPISAGHGVEPSSFAAYSIPIPTISRQVQPISREPNVTEPPEDGETPIPIAYATLGDGPVEPPKSRVIFRKPNIPAE